MLLLFTLCASLAVAQIPATKSACAILTPEDAATILGPDPLKVESEGSCVYMPQKGPVSLSIRVSSVETHGQEVMTTQKQMLSQMGGATQEEASLGAGLFSSNFQNTLAIHVLKGEVMAEISISEPSEQPLEDKDLLPKLCTITQKALARL
jgi:hypothetical protein